MNITRAVLHGARDLRFEESELNPAALAPDELLVRTLCSGFSTGTDLANYQGRSEEIPGAPGYPRGVGYSNVGVVESTGVRVFSIKPHCSAFVAGPNDLLVPVPDGVSSADASLAYMVHLGITALRQVRYEPGESVLVVGLGVIGLGTIAAARAMGARVAALGNSEQRCEAARNMGAHEAHLTEHFKPAELFGRQPADIVVLTANSWEAYRQSFQAVRFGGRIAVLGFPGRALPPPDFNPLDAQWLYGKQLTITGAGHMSRLECAPSDIRFNLRRDLEFLFQLMSTGDVDLAPLLSHQVPFRQMREVYELADRHAKELTAAVFEWSEA